MLDAIVGAGHPVPLVVSRADARRGRGNALTPSPVKARALQLGLECTDDLDVLRTVDLPADAIGVVVAYGRIIPVGILERLPMLNVHFSLLPRWRGAAPVERAILEGDEVTGVCIMKMEEGLDTGAVYARSETRIGASETSAELTDRLAHEGARLMCRVLAGPLPQPEEQSGEHTYAKKITAADTVIDWSEPAESVLRRIRAVPAHTMHGDRRLRVIAAQHSPAAELPHLRAGELSASGDVGTSGSAVRLVTVQPEGKRPMDARDWLRGLNAEFPVRLGKVP